MIELKLSFDGSDRHPEYLVCHGKSASIDVSLGSSDKAVVEELQQGFRFGKYELKASLDRGLKDVLPIRVVSREEEHVEVSDQIPSSGQSNAITTTEHLVMRKGGSLNWRIVFPRAFCRYFWPVRLNIAVVEGKAEWASAEVDLVNRLQWWVSGLSWLLVIAMLCLLSLYIYILNKGPGLTLITRGATVVVWGLGVLGIRIQTWRIWLYQRFHYLSVFLSIVGVSIFIVVCLYFTTTCFVNLTPESTTAVEGYESSAIRPGRASLRWFGPWDKKTLDEKIGCTDRQDPNTKAVLERMGAYSGTEIHLPFYLNVFEKKHIGCKKNRNKSHPTKSFLGAWKKSGECWPTEPFSVSNRPLSSFFLNTSDESENVLVDAVWSQHSSNIFTNFEKENWNDALVSLKFHPSGEEERTGRSTGLRLEMLWRAPFVKMSVNDVPYGTPVPTPISRSDGERYWKGDDSGGRILTAKVFSGITELGVLSVRGRLQSEPVFKCCRDWTCESDSGWPKIYTSMLTEQTPPCLRQKCKKAALFNDGLQCVPSPNRTIWHFNEEWNLGFYCVLDYPEYKPTPCYTIKSSGQLAQLSLRIGENEKSEASALFRATSPDLSHKVPLCLPREFSEADSKTGISLDVILAKGWSPDTDWGLLLPHQIVPEKIRFYTSNGEYLGRLEIEGVGERENAKKLRIGPISSEVQLLDNSIELFSDKQLEKPKITWETNSNNQYAKNWFWSAAYFGGEFPSEYQNRGKSANGTKRTLECSDESHYRICEWKFDCGDCYLTLSGDSVSPNDCRCTGPMSRSLMEKECSKGESYSNYCIVRRRFNKQCCRTIRLCNCLRSK